MKFIEISQEAYPFKIVNNNVHLHILPNINMIILYPLALR